MAIQLIEIEDVSLRSLFGDHLGDLFENIIELISADLSVSIFVAGIDELLYVGLVNFKIDSQTIDRHLHEL